MGDIVVNIEDDEPVYITEDNGSNVIVGNPEYMLKSVYDGNKNNVVDVAEGIRVMDNLPAQSAVKKGDVILVNGEVYIKI